MRRRGVVTTVIGVIALLLGLSAGAEAANASLLLAVLGAIAIVVGIVRLVRSE